MFGKYPNFFHLTVTKKAKHSSKSHPVKLLLSSFLVFLLSSDVNRLMHDPKIIWCFISQPVLLLPADLQALQIEFKQMTQGPIFGAFQYSPPPPLLSSSVISMQPPLHHQVWLTAILLPRLFCHLSCSAMPAGWLHSTTSCGDNNLHWSYPSAYPAVTNSNRLSCGSAIDCPTLVCVCTWGWVCVGTWSAAVPSANYFCLFCRYTS